MSFFTAGVVAVAAFAILLLAQRQAESNLAQVQLRQENETLREQLRQAQETARQQAGSAWESSELERLRQTQNELPRLRGEVDRLRRELQAASAQSSRTAQTVVEDNPDKVPVLTDVPIVGRLFRAESNGLDFQWFLTNVTPAMDTDPAAAFAYSERLSPAERRKYLDLAFAAWAQKDTEAALQWVEQQLSDPAEKEAALKAIRSAAPVGIGAELRQQDGYTVLNRVVPGSPAELSGQLHPGDRILAVAQGDSAFVDAHTLGLPNLAQSIRGAPGTLIQLQVLPADAPPDSPPKIVTLRRDQIKFKR